jgi:hypothetical protein
MVINTTFQSMHGAGEFQKGRAIIGSFTLSVLASLKENTPNFQGGNNPDTRTLETENCGLWLAL